MSESASGVGVTAVMVCARLKVALVLVSGVAVTSQGAYAGGPVKPSYGSRLVT